MGAYRRRSPVPSEYLCVARRTRVPWLLRALAKQKLYRKRGQVDLLVAALADVFDVPVPAVRWKSRGQSRAHLYDNVIEISAKDEGMPGRTDAWMVAHEIAHLIVYQRGKQGRGPVVFSREIHRWEFVRMLDKVVLAAVELLP